MTITYFDPTARSGADSGADDPLYRFVADAARSLGRAVTRGDLPPFTEQRDAQVGILAVPAAPADAVAEAVAFVERVRSAGSTVALLLLAESSDEEGNYAGPNTPVDEIINISSPMAAKRFARFAQSQSTASEAAAVRLFLDSAADGYWIWTISSDVVAWSTRTRVLTRIAEDDVPTSLDAFIERIHPDDRAPVGVAITDHLENGVPYRDVSMRIRGTSGTYRDFVASGQAIRDGSGAPIALVGALTDLTTQNAMQRQLEEERQLHASLFHFMNDAAVLADPETGLVIDANEPAERLWKRSRTDLIGSHQTSLHPEIRSEAARLAFENHIIELQRDNRASIQIPIVTSAGDEIPTEISSSLIHIGGRTHILGVFRDISDRVQAATAIRERDAQLQLASRLAAMGSLAAGVGHEINNPLTYIVGNLAYVEQELRDDRHIDEDVRDAISEAIEGANRVREIVADLKTITRSDDQNGECDPADVVRIATRIAMADIRHRANVDLRVGDHPVVAISSSRLTQVLLNVLTNAGHSMKAEGKDDNTITVEILTQPDRVQIRCTDNGTGIEPEHLDRIFEPYFTTKSDDSGTGLGLSISRRILSEIGGSIRIESELGVGTTAIIEVPRVEPAISIPEETVSVVDPSKPRVLVIDDDPLIGKAIDRILRRDYDVTFQSEPNGAMAEILAGTDFDAILCDLMMPSMCGEEVFDAVSANRPDLVDKMIFITGGAVTPGCARFEAEMQTVNRVLIKPITAGELLDRVGDLVAGNGTGPTSHARTAD